METKTINWAKSCQNDDGGFGNAPAFSSTMDYTVAGLAVLAEFNSRPDDVKGCIEWVKSCQNDDGGFGRTPDDEISYTDYTCSALAALYLLGLYPQKISECMGFIKSCENDDGGYARTPGAPSDMDSTASAVSSLNMLGEKPHHPQDAVRYVGSLRTPWGYRSSACGDANVEYSALALTILEVFGAGVVDRDLAEFAKSCQNDDGGFGELPDRPSNIDYSYSALEILQKAGVKPLEFEKCIEFVNACKNEDGGFGWIPGSPSRVEYTYYGINCIKYLKI